MGCNLPVAIGRSGISKKIGEGDGITPIGKFSIMGIGFRNDRISFKSANVEMSPLRSMIYGLMTQRIKIITIKFTQTIIRLATKSFAGQITYMMHLEF
jgi:hypothetical protein